MLETLSGWFSFIEPKTVYLIFHLLGVVIGAGGAYMSDAIFFSTIKDREINDTELRFIKLGSRMVWIGLLILFISGLFLFSLDANKYIHSEKFLAKMTIVIILTINGIFFHFVHIKRLFKHRDELIIWPNSFIKESRLLYPSGAISMVSWTSAIVLGAFKNIPWSYQTIMLVYVGVIFTAIIVSFILRHRFLSPILPHRRHTKLQTPNSK